MNFYTYARHYGDKILFRGIKDGKRVAAKHDFEPTLFVPTDKPYEYKSIFGDNVAPMKFPTNKEATAFFERYKDVSNFPIYGQNYYAYQYITEKYPGTVDWDANGETGTWNWMLSDNLNPIPEGWRVATNDDWMSLEINLGMDSSVAASWGYRISGNVGEKLKSTNFGGNNSSGFNVSEYINGNGYDSDCKRYLVNQAFIGNNGVVNSYRGFERDYDGILFNISFQENNGGNPASDPQSDGNTNGPFFYHVRLVKDN